MSKSDKSQGVKITVNGKERSFDVDDPKLPDWVSDKAMESGGYPYEDKLDRKEYEETLERLQVELVRCSSGWLKPAGA